MIAFLSWVGQAVWPLVAGLMPWGGAKFGLVIAALLAGVIAIGAPAGAVWLNMRGEVKVAVSQCRASCAAQVTNAELAAQRAIADVLNEVAGTETPQTSADVERFCREQPTLCRDGGEK